jgi:hypothetical protein
LAREREAERHHRLLAQRLGLLEQEDLLEALATEESYSFTVRNPRGRYGVATLCLDPATEASVELQIMYYTVQERTSLWAGCWFGYGDDDGEVPQLYILEGAVAGLSEDETAQVHAAFAASDPVSADHPYYLLETVGGVHELVGVKYPDADWRSLPSGYVMTPISVNRDRQGVDIDFAGPDAFAPEVRTVTIDGLHEGEMVIGYASYWTTLYTLVPVGYGEDESSFNYAGIPADERVGDAFHSAFAYSFEEDGAASSTSRSAEAHMISPVDVTLTLPRTFGEASTDVVSTSPYVRLRTTWEGYEPVADYSLSYSRWDWENNESRWWYITFSPGWLGAGTEHSYTTPDFSALPGWNNTWGHRPGLELHCSISTFGSSGRYGSDGFRFYHTSRGQQLTP